MGLLNKLQLAIWGPSRKVPVTDHERLPYIYLQDELLLKTANMLKSYRNKAQYHEGIMYWAGIATEVGWFVTTCVSPRAQTTRGSYSTDVKANAEVIAFISKYNLTLLAQVHSHPGENVNHSNGDDRGAFMPYSGFLSIVVPEYGMRGMQPLETCGIHRFERDGFRRLSNGEIKDIFRLLPLSHDMRKNEAGKDVYV